MQTGRVLRTFVLPVVAALGLVATLFFDWYAAPEIQAIITLGRRDDSDWDLVSGSLFASGWDGRWETAAVVGVAAALLLATAAAARVRAAAPLLLVPCAIAFAGVAIHALADDLDDLALAPGLCTLACLAVAARATDRPRPAQLALAAAIAVLLSVVAQTGYGWYAGVGEPQPFLRGEGATLYSGVFTTPVPDDRTASIVALVVAAVAAAGLVAPRRAGLIVLVPAAIALVVGVASRESAGEDAIARLPGALLVFGALAVTATAVYLQSPRHDRS